MAAFELTKTVLKDNANLKAYYRFESGALTTDTQGVHTLTAVSDPAETTGVYGGGVILDSDDAYSITDHADFKPTGAFTIGGWVKRSATGAYAFFAQSFSNAGGGTIGWQLGFNNSNQAYFVVGYASLKTASSTATYTDGAWHHFVATCDGTNIRLYVDGAIVATTASSYPTYYSTNYVRIGCANYSGTNTDFFNGSLDDVFLVNGTALSADQIKELYEGRFLGEAYPQAGLVGGWHLNGSSTDFSGNNYHGTDTAITYSQANGKFGQGAGFNGSSSVVSLGTTINPFTGDFSLSAWIKLGATGADKTIFGKYGAGATDQWLLFYIVSTGVLSLSFYGDDLSSTKTISDTTSWHHVAATYAYGAKTKTLYIDGNQVAQANGTGNPNFGSNALLIGKLNTGTYWNGNIDEALVYNRVLTPQEIRRMYAQGTGKLQ